jgi:DNA repair protein RecO (recombination protein O)
VGLYRDTGVVLRTHKLGEADRIVVLLTRDTGIVRAVAKGVRRTTSRFGARLEPFTHVDVQLHTGRTLDVVTQAQTVAAYGERLAGSYSRYTTGTAMLETTLRLLPVEREPAPPLLSLLVGGLHALAVTGRDPGLVLDSFAVRALATAGYAPSFDGCGRCGAPGPHVAVSVSSGGAVCPSCRSDGSTSAVAVDPATMVLLGALLAGDWGAAEAGEDWARRQASGVVSALLQWTLEAGIRSWRHVERDTGRAVGGDAGRAVEPAAAPVPARPLDREPAVPR